MNSDHQAIENLRKLIELNGQASAYVTFEDHGNMCDYDDYEYEDDYSDIYDTNGHYVANVKVFEVTATGLDTKEYSGSEIFIPFEDIISVTV